MVREVAGQTLLAATDRTEYGAREDVAVTVERFLSEDPLQGDSTNPPSLHKYLYAHANPTVFIDPTGLAAEVSWSDEDDIPEGTVYFVVEEKTKDGTQQVFYNADPEAWTAADTFLFGGPEAIRERSKDLKRKERGFFGDLFAGVKETVSRIATTLAERLKPGQRTAIKLQEFDESTRAGRERGVVVLSGVSTGDPVASLAKITRLWVPCPGFFPSSPQIRAS